MFKQSVQFRSSKSLSVDMPQKNAVLLVPGGQSAASFPLLSGSRYLLIPHWVQAATM